MPKRKSWPLALISLSVSLGLCSCSSTPTIFTKYNINIPKDTDLTKGEVENKLPLIAGIYFEPHFRNYVLKEKHPTFGNKITYHIGEVLSNNCERMLRNIFRDVVIVDQKNEISSTKNVDVFVSPTVLHIGKVTPSPTFVSFSKDVTLMIIEMRWDIGSPGGKVIYTTTMIGETYRKNKVCFSLSCYEGLFAEDMLALLDDQFSKAQDDIYTNTWWKDQWWKSSN